MTEVIFAIGTIWFWILFTIASIVILAAIENEKGLLATIALVAAVVAIYVWGDKEVFSWMRQHPWKTAGGVGGYFAAGTFWFITKWWRFVRMNRHKYDEAFALFKTDFQKDDYIPRRAFQRGRGSDEYKQMLDIFKRQKAGETDVVFKEEWSSHIGEKNYKGIFFEFKPKYRDHRNQIFLWACYWPWSAFWTLLSDPIKKIWDGIIHLVRGLLERISASSFRDVEQYDPEKAKEQERLKVRSNGRCDLGHEIVKRSEKEIMGCNDCFNYIEANPKIIDHIDDESAREMVRGLMDDNK
jgi:hypothetical protein